MTLARGTLSGAKLWQIFPFAKHAGPVLHPEGEDGAVGRQNEGGEEWRMGDI